MKVLGPVLFVILAAPAASADHIALDYWAEDASCIDASRFADEVSAKLGFVPWAASAPAAIRVRVTREGDGFSGTVKNVDGTAKIIDGKTCAEVTANLAVTVAAAVDRKPEPPAMPATPPAVPAPIAPAPAEPPTSDGRFPVMFQSLDGHRVDIAIDPNNGAAARVGGKPVTNLMTNLCTTPCTTQLPSGRHYLRFKDPDAGAEEARYFMIEGPSTITMRKESRRGVRIGLVVGGIALAGIGYAAVHTAGRTEDNQGILGVVGVVAGLSALAVATFIHDGYTSTLQPN